MILDGKNTSNSLISGTALINQAREKISTNISNSAEVFELEKSGNVFAKEIIENFKRNLTVLLLNISSTINPEIIVLGGGVLKSKDRFLDEVIDNFKEKAHILAQDTIIDTAYFDEPGIVGAMLLAKRHFE
jgi:glucokinase